MYFEAAREWLSSWFEDLHVESFGLLPREHPVHNAEPPIAVCQPSVAVRSDPRAMELRTAMEPHSLALSSTVRRSACPTP